MEKELPDLLLKQRKVRCSRLGRRFDLMRNATGSRKLWRDLPLTSPPFEESPDVNIISASRFLIIGPLVELPMKEAVATLTVMRERLDCTRAGHAYTPVRGSETNTNDLTRNGGLFVSSFLERFLDRSARKWNRKCSWFSRSTISWNPKLLIGISIAEKEIWNLLPLLRRVCKSCLMDNAPTWR